MTFDDGMSSSSDSRTSVDEIDETHQSHLKANQLCNEELSTREKSSAVRDPDNYVMAVVDKTKKTASFLWLLLHAKGCRVGASNDCPHRGCKETKRLLEHIQSCPTAGSCLPCPEKSNGCQQARKLLAHYRQCREIRARQLRLKRLKHTCLLCTMLERHDRAARDTNDDVNTRCDGNQPKINITQTADDMQCKSKDEQTSKLPRSFSGQVMPPPPPRPRTYSMGSNSSSQTTTSFSQRILPLPDKNCVPKCKLISFENKAHCGRKVGRLRARSFDEKARRILGDHDTNNELSIEFILSNLKHSREEITDKEMEGGLKGLGSSKKGRSASVGGYLPLSNSACDAIMEE